MFTDPPYGVNYVGGTAERLVIKNDALSEPALVQLLEAALGAAPLRAGAPWYVCSPGGNRQLPFLLALRSAGFELRQVIVWVKDRFVLGRSDYHYQHEDILVGERKASDPEKEGEPIAYGWKPGAAHTWEGGRRQSTVWQIERPAASRQHPTMKPIELVRRALANSAVAGAVVYEPFSGSGSTIIAAEQLGFACRAIELDPVYVQVAVERWEAFTGRKAVTL